MSQPVIKVPYKEDNNQSGGRSGSQTRVMPGPAANKGDLGKNATPGGGIFRPTKGKPSSGGSNY